MDKKRIIGLDVGDRRIGIAVSDPLGLTAQPVVLKGRRALAVEGMTAVMVNGNLGHQGMMTCTEKQREVDVLWITRGFRGARLDDIAGVYRPRLLVLDASLARWQRGALKTEALRQGWRVYDVAEEGALRLRIGDE